MCSLFLNRSSFELTGVMAVVPAIAVRFSANSGEVLLFPIPAPQPGKLLLVPYGFLPAVFVPFDIWPRAQNAGALFATGDVLFEEGADVQAHAVVNVRIPADGLFRERFPADEEVKRRLTSQDQLEPSLQLLGALQAGIPAGLPAINDGLLTPDPIAEGSVGEFFQVGMV